MTQKDKKYDQNMTKNPPKWPSITKNAPKLPKMNQKRPKIPKMNKKLITKND
jgi:hypothetical protein